MGSFTLSTARVIAFPVLWWFRPYDFDSVWIDWFLKWFGSIVGFKQQSGFMFGWIIVVIIHPNLDPNMLHLMVFLTIYSAVTQPMIAIQNSHAGTKLDDALLLLQSNDEKMMAMVISQGKQIEALMAVITELKGVKASVTSHND